jgi:TonB family protein
LPLPTSPESDAPGSLDFPRVPLKADSSDAAPAVFLDVLRDALSVGNYSIDAILGAIADAARVLMGADATAIALRVEEAIVCKARTGEIAPQLGARLNVDHGISGECFRTARTIRCDDTEADARVDAEVCRILGIRSIAAVPLRLRAETFGMIEALSSRAHAFDEKQVKALECLGEITEDAYEKKTVSPQPTTETASARTEVSINLIPEDSKAGNRRRLWIFAAIAAVILMALTVVWWTWHEPSGEFEGNPIVVSNEGETDSTANKAAAAALIPRPSPIIGTTSPNGSATGIVKNAAKIEADDTTVTTFKVSASVTPPRSTSRSASNSFEEPPPTILPSASFPSASENNEKLATVASSTTPLPELDAKVSEGVKESSVVRRVEPVYPAEALKRKIEGPVTVQASITEKGTVGDIKVVSGEPLLAAAAIEAISKWLYTPTLLNGKPTIVQKEITINFKLP